MAVHLPTYIYPVFSRQDSSLLALNCVVLSASCCTPSCTVLHCASGWHFSSVYVHMDLLNWCLAEHCRLMWYLGFSDTCPNPLLLAFNHPSPHALQTTAVGFFLPSCGVRTFPLLLFIAFGEVVVRTILSRVDSVFKLQDQIVINWLWTHSGGKLGSYLL